MSLPRRSFLKLSALALSSLAAVPLRTGLPPEDVQAPVGLGRVTVSAIRVYKEPSYKAETVGWRARDRILDIIEEMPSPHGPAHNPRWYRVVGGYAHSAYIQRVETATLNSVISNIPEKGIIGEITVPYIRSLRHSKSAGWTPLYRLYFGSTHWITGKRRGPDGAPWYELVDDRLRVKHYIPASHIRPIPPEELAPLSPEVPFEKKRIVISLSQQTVTAYEGKREVFHTTVSTGLPTRGTPSNGIPTDTPTGNFNISLKTPSRHMGDGNLTSDLEAYELPGVPWCSFFVSTGIAFHGAYWHDNFGARMSHGCINMRNHEAKWIYRWTSPAIDYHEWYQQGFGTLIQVID